MLADPLTKPMDSDPLRGAVTLGFYPYNTTQTARVKQRTLREIRQQAMLADDTFHVDDDDGADGLQTTSNVHASQFSVLCATVPGGPKTLFTQFYGRDGAQCWSRSWLPATWPRRPQGAPYH